ncbi:hypothetical protein [Maricaulis sp.]|uniref:hypothetical protein n=1 Tax=Maricaulis sp. TaxID=1486257 RepID=UPI002B271960|nr:hypothetical protein [Maricaulis sp.]
MWVRGLQANGARTFVVAPELPDDIDGIAVHHPNVDPSTRPPARPGLKDHLRDLLLWPDPDIRWARKAMEAARRACPFVPDWIFTTSPPESVHAVGHALKRTWPSARWVVDARDQWMLRPFRAERRQLLRRTLEPVLARHILRKCDAVLAVNEAIAGELASYAPQAAQCVVPHFTENTETPHPFDEATINLVHTGSFKLSDPDVSIDQLMAPFEQATEINPKLRLHLVGRLRDDEVARIHSSPARSRVILHGTVPLDESMQLQAGADALMVAAAKASDAPPGKLTEYRAAGRPILPVGPGSWRRHVDDSTEDQDVRRIGAVTKAVGDTDMTKPATPTEAVAKALQFLATRA